VSGRHSCPYEPTPDFPLELTPDFPDTGFSPHRGDDPQLREPPHILLADDLGVLDPKPGIVGLRHSLQDARVSVKYQRIAAIADGMSGDLRR